MEAVNGGKKQTNDLYGNRNHHGTASGVSIDQTNAGAAEHGEDGEPKEREEHQKV